MGYMPLIFDMYIYLSYMNMYIYMVSIMHIIITIPYRLFGVHPSAFIGLLPLWSYPIDHRLIGILFMQ